MCIDAGESNILARLYRVSRKAPLGPVFKQLCEWVFLLLNAPQGLNIFNWLFLCVPLLRAHTLHTQCLAISFISISRSANSSNFIASVFLAQLSETLLIQVFNNVQFVQRWGATGAELQGRSETVERLVATISRNQVEGVKTFYGSVISFSRCCR